MIRTITATEYVTPLREGGSLPAIVAGDDDGTYVVKFRGAGQGARALLAELVSGEIARALNIELDHDRLLALDPSVDLAAVETHLATIPKVCAGGEEAGSIGNLAQRARFHWLVAPRSTVIQTSAVHSGVHSDVNAALESLFEKLVRSPK